MTTRSENLRPALTREYTRTLERLLRQVREWATEEALRRQVYYERRQLLAMSDAMLADLGISRAEARAEAQRRDLPAARLQQLKRDRRR